MFSVIFEVNPKQEKFDLYLDLAKGLKPILEGIDGFIYNERFESTRRRGWILSHSTWRDEKSVGEVADGREAPRHPTARPGRGVSGLPFAGGRDRRGHGTIRRRGDRRAAAGRDGDRAGEVRDADRDSARIRHDRRSTSGVAVARSKSGGPDRLRRFCQYLQRGEARAAGVVARPALGGEIQPAGVPALATGSCASSATTACSIDARAPSTTPRSKPGRRRRRNRSRANAAPQAVEGGHR